MKISFLLTAIIFFCLIGSCTEETKILVNPPVKLSQRDTLLFKKYAQLIGRVPLFSTKRQKYLDTLLLIDHTNSKVWQQKAMPLFKQKKYEIGMEYLDSAIKYDKGNEYLGYRGFIKCIFQKNYRAALKDLSVFKKMNKSSYIMDHDPNFYIGLCYLQLNMFDQAGSLFSQNIEEYRKKFGSKWINCSDLFYQGISYYETENYKKAIDSFNESLKRYNNFADAKYYKAVCLENLGRKREALLLIREAEMNYKSGYSIPETNAMYEIYPYQVNKFALQQYREKLELIKYE